MFRICVIFTLLALIAPFTQSTMLTTTGTPNMTRPNGTTNQLNNTGAITGYNRLLLFPNNNNPSLLAKKIGFNVLTSFIYSLSIVPLFLAIGSLFAPWPHGKTQPTGACLNRFTAKPVGFNGRRKRAVVNDSHLYRHLPLLNRDETKRFLSLFETTLKNKKIHNETCKKYYSCMVFHEAIKRESFPRLSDLEIAMLNVFGIVVERFDHQLDLIPTVKMYYEIATDAFKGISCAHKYPCANDGTIKRRLQIMFDTKRN